MAGYEEYSRKEATGPGLELYSQRRAEGVDFRHGPCLAWEIVPDWCVDIAHNPRQLADDLPENQYACFRKGRVRSFVALDPEENRIHAR